jgi:hypothetical protein
MALLEMRDRLVRRKFLTLWMSNSNGGRRKNRTDPSVVRAPISPKTPLSRSCFLYSIIFRPFQCLGFRTRDFPIQSSSSVFVYVCATLLEIPNTDIVILDTADTEDSRELSFRQGEILDIGDKQGDWWQARNANGSIGSMFFASPSRERPTDMFLF